MAISGLRCSAISTVRLPHRREVWPKRATARSGNLSVYIEDSSKLSTSDYEVTFSSATGYSVRRLSDGADLGSYDLSDDPAPVIDGFSLALEAGPLPLATSSPLSLLVPQRAASVS